MLGLWTTEEQNKLAHKLNITEVPKQIIYKIRDSLLKIESIYIQSAIKLIKHKTQIRDRKSPNE